MRERIVTVVPEDGLHALPARLRAPRARARVPVEDVMPTVWIDGVRYEVRDGSRSMLAVTSLGVESGEDVRLEAAGDDAEAALSALEEVLSTPEADV